MIENIITGFAQFSGMTWAMVFGGVVCGLIFGCIPGLSGSTALTLAIPLSLVLDPVPAFGLFMGIFISGCSGGCISAILVGVPGTSSSLTTVFDGYPMAKHGQPGKALGTAILCSFLGTFISLIVLFVLAEPLARFGVKLGPVELFSLILFALSLISVLAGDKLILGWVVALTGVLLGMVGISTVDGATRMIVGIKKLTSGFSRTPAMLGIFVVGSLFAASKADKSYRGDQTIMDFSIKGFGITVKEFVGQLGNFARSAIIGVGIGILPGIGGVTSNLVAYTVAKSMSKTPEKFGTGCLDGIVAPETANNAAIGGSMVPLLGLGIPGDGFTALLLGAFEMHGFISGPTLFIKNSEFVYAIFAALLLSCILTVVLEYFGLPLLVKSLKIPVNILMPIIMVLVMVGSFCVHNRLFECWVLLFFALVAYLFRAFKFTTTPIVLGFILGADAEVYLRRGLMMNRNDVTVFVRNPVSLLFIILAVLCTVIMLRQNRRNAAKLKEHASASEADIDAEIADD